MAIWVEVDISALHDGSDVARLASKVARNCCHDRVCYYLLLVWWMLDVRSGKNWEEAESESERIF